MSKSALINPRGANGASGVPHAASTEAPPPDSPASAPDSHRPSMDRATSSTTLVPQTLPDGIDLVPGTNIVLNNLPRDYLQSYPYPAFVLATAIPNGASGTDGASFPRTWTASSLSEIDSLAPVWANRKWAKVASGRSTLLECLSLDGIRRFGEWILDWDGVNMAKANVGGLALSLGSVSLGSAIVGSGSTETPALDDDFGDDEFDTAASQTITLEFSFANRSLVLELTKTLVPLFVYRKSEQRQICTHAFAVITTRPRPPRHVDVKHRSGSGHSVRHSPKGQGDTIVDGSPINATDALPRPDDELPARLVLPYSSPVMEHRDAVRLVEDAAWSLGQSLFFMRDGGVHRPAPPQNGYSPDGRSYDVNDLFRQLEQDPRCDNRLRFMIGFLKVLPVSSALWWGKDLTLIYNQGYAAQLQHHPSVFGKSGTAGWAELWTALGPQTEVVLKGTSIFKEDDFVLLKQDGKDAYFESYRSQMWAPFRLEDGSFGGIMHSVMETTRRVLEERRNGFLRELAERTANIRSVEDFYQGVLEVIEENARDAPFGLLFSVGVQSDPTPVRRRSSSNAKLTEQLPIRAKIWYVGGIGVPPDHPSAPAETQVSIPPPGDPTDVMLAEAFSNPTLQESDPNAPSSSPPSLKRSVSSAGIRVSRSSYDASSHARSSYEASSRSGSSKRDGSRSRDSKLETTQPADNQWPFVLALHTGNPVYVEDCTALIEGYPIRVWDDSPTSAIVIPIARNTDTGVASAVLVLGLSCRLRFDESYESFINLLRSQMATQLAAVRGYSADQLRIQELGSLDRAKSMLFSNVAHELFTPLTLVTAPLDDALADMEPGSVRDGLVIARRNARRLTRLISILRDVSNLEAGRFKGSFHLVNLGELTRDSAALFRKAASKAELEYIVSCDTTPHEVYVDREQWDKILFTLIGNAINYTMEGSIKVSLHYDGAEVVLTVQDTGPGIPASDLKYVGERFYRGESVQGRHDGSGVTLSFAKKLIEMHMGVLEVESKCKSETADGSHGSTFRVRMPLGNGHLPPDLIGSRSNPVSTARVSDGWELSDAMDDVPETASNISTGSTPNTGNGFMAGNESDSAPTPTSTHSLDSVGTGSAGGSPTAPVRIPGRIGPRNRDGRKRVSGIDPSTLWFDPSDVIMIVDDLHDTRRYLRSILQPFCRVVEAHDGIEALEMFDETRPDLIISDMILPRLNGFELLRQLRCGRREQRMVPFLMLTSLDNARPDNALEADDLLSKPFNAKELIARAHLQLQLGKKRRAMEALFEERTQELRVIMDSSPVGFFRCTPDGYVSYANQAWYELVGYPPGAVITNWGDYIVDEDQRRIRAVWEEYIETGAESCAAEWQWKNKRYVSTKVVRVQSQLGDGKPRGSIGVSIEITDRILHENLQKQRVQEAEQRRAEAEEAKFQQELLIDITSHEIRNPISSLMQISLRCVSIFPANTVYCSSLVKSNLLVLREQLQAALDSQGAFTPTHQLLATIGEDLEALDSIYECGLTQERISNDVLSLGKIQLDMLQMFDVDSSIQREAQKIVSVFQNEARMKRIELCLRVSPAFEQLGIHSIKTDHVRLGQIMTNLLTNAIRFTANSPIRRIELKLDVGLDPPSPGQDCRKPPSASPTSSPRPTHPVVEDSTVYLFVSVSDTGPGLTRDELETLFQRFSQASPKTHTMYGGSGLGLFVCRKLTELLGGRISVTSEPNRGSEFSFFIRVKAGAHTSVLSRPSSTSSPHLPGFAVDGNLKVKPRVLVVEDNLINRTVLIRQLKHVGLLVDSAQDGQEALEKIQRVMVPRPETDDVPDDERPYDVVLMDLEMPVMDGYTAAQRVRGEENAGRLETSLIIALTGNARQVQIDEAMADFDDVVIKPYRLDNLLKKMENLIRRRLDGNVRPLMPRRQTE